MDKSISCIEIVCNMTEYDKDLIYDILKLLTTTTAKSKSFSLVHYLLNRHINSQLQLQFQEGFIKLAVDLESSDN